MAKQIFLSFAILLATTQFIDEEKRNSELIEKYHEAHYQKMNEPSLKIDKVISGFIYQMSKEFTESILK